MIALGGGSPLDAGKVIAFMAGQKRKMWDFEDIGDWWTRADPAGIAPVIAVPTTAGTGSEVGRAGVITQEATHTKKVIFHPGMMPKITICDPELTVGMPPRITAGTGLDALAHCFEAIARRATTQWQKASRWKACASSRNFSSVPTGTGKTSRHAPI